MLSRCIVHPFLHFGEDGLPAPGGELQRARRHSLMSSGIITCQQKKANGPHFYVTTGISTRVGYLPEDIKLSLGEIEMA